MENIARAINELMVEVRRIADVMERNEPKDEPQTIAEDINRRVEMGKKEWNARHIEDDPQTEPLPKAINGVRIADAVAWADKWLEDNPVSEMWDMIRTLRDATEWYDEPQTERSN